MVIKKILKKYTHTPEFLMEIYYNVCEPLIY